jgi:CubicO group peptidase (beta-lactamase class C family)
LQKDSLNQELDNIIQPSLETVAPAVALAVFHGGDKVVHRAWGTNVDTLFDLASLTKLYTTTALFALLTKTGQRLDVPLVQFIPEFGADNPRSMDGGQDPHTKEHLPVPEHLVGKNIDVRQVTLWHLLTHTSGLPPWRDIYNVASAPPPPTEDDNLSAEERWRLAMARLVGLPFVGDVGSEVRYSDVGLMLLGEVAARLHQASLGDAIEQLVLAPMELRHTMFAPVRDHAIALDKIAPTEVDTTWRKRRVHGEVHDENACGVGGIAGHAGLFGTVSDVARFGQAWLEQSWALDAHFYQEATQEQATTGADIRGLGWMLRSPDNSSAGDLMSMRAYGHTGFTGTSLWIDPEHELVVAFLTNRVYYGRENPGIHGLRRAVHDAIMRALP